MGKIRVGTASWTDKTLLESGWYPETSTRPRRSGWPTTPSSSRWSRSTPPTTPRRAEQTAALWAERTPEGFTFNIKAFSLLTGHPTKVSVDLQGPAAGDRQEATSTRTT